MSEAPKTKIAVLERNRVVGSRIARVMCATGGLGPVPVVDDPADLHDVLAPEPLLLGCDAIDLDVALEWVRDRYPTMSLVVWTSGSTERALRASLVEPRLASVIGWPSFESMPRPWEIGLVVRRVVQPSAASPRLADLLGWGATVLKWRPRTSDDRDRVVGEVARWAERSGANARLAERLAELAHELLMNAMYDAPINADGQPRYAFDRQQDIALEEAEIPTLRLGTDGVHIALQASDPFGRLRRHHVLEGILRGLGARRESLLPGAILDTSGGGAGLGMLKIYSAGAVLLVDVEPSVATTVTSLYDLDVNPREFRSIPASLHFFQRTGVEPAERTTRGSVPFPR